MSNGAGTAVSHGETFRFFRGDAALFIGPLPPPELHAHHAIQGCVALEGRLEVRTPEGDPLRAEAALIAADVPHAVAGSGLVAHFYALPDSESGRRMAAGLGKARVAPLAVPRLPRLRRRLRRALSDEELFPSCLEALLELAPGVGGDAGARDARVARVVETLRRSDPDASLGELSKQVALSPDRLRHLIRDEIGISLKRYRRFVRLLSALEAMERGADVTAAAQAAGFSDAAHLSRCFSEAFTFPPSVFLRDSRFVQAGRDRSE